ncbi:MAG: site-specific integrase [Terriglobia bacterium]|jgi:integrase
MANRKASLIRCAKIPGQGWRRGILIKTKNGRIKPDFMTYKGQQLYCPQGKYEIRFYKGSKAIQKPVGKDLDAALATFALFEKKLQYDALQEDLGIKMPEPSNADRKTISKLRDGYIEKYAHGSVDSIRKYTFVGKEFSRLLSERQKEFPAQVTEDDVIAFDHFLDDRGDSKSTRSHRYGYVRCFLRYIGLDPNKVVSPEWNQKLKKKPKLEVENYTEEELQRLYAASSEYHRLVWRCYRMFGFRDEELAYWEWDNINWNLKMAEVRFKRKGSYSWNPELEWVSKDSEERDVPIPDVLLEELKAWRKKNPNTRFVFGTRNDRPNIKFLKALKSDWRVAGLNCGKCSGCRKKKECRRAKLKTFRATYLTTMLNHTNSRNVQKLAGHSSLATTERYLRPAGMSDLQAAANAAFS